jgi:hypothetical protein
MSIGVVADAIFVAILLGLLAGVVVWYYGVQEINRNYTPYVQQFLSETERAAERTIHAEDLSTYSFLHSTGKSPPFVEPADRYYATILNITAKSVTVTEDAEYDLVAREQVGRGRRHELFYDQITAVESYQDSEQQNTLEIRTADAGSITVRSTDEAKIKDGASRLRQHVRDAKS